MFDYSPGSIHVGSGALSPGRSGFDLSPSDCQAPHSPRLIIMSNNNNNNNDNNNNNNNNNNLNNKGRIDDYIKNLCVCVYLLIVMVRTMRRMRRSNL